MHTRAHRRFGFTLIELLVVVTIIALLIGLFFAVFGGARNKADVSITQTLMSSITKGIDAFEGDFNYQPPLLVPDTYVSGADSADSPYPSAFPDSFEFVDPIAQNDADAALRNSRYFSLISLTAYLVGNVDLAPADYSPSSDPDRHDGAAGAGIRNPGGDHSWGGAQFRDGTTHAPSITGQVYGPYVDIGSGNVTRREYDFRPVSGHAMFDPLLLENSNRQLPVFVDAWGSPIRYYRELPKRDRDTGDLSTIHTPVELMQNNLIAGTQAGLSTETRMEALNAANRSVFQSSYHLVSAGPDGFFATTGDDDEDEELARGSVSAQYDLDDFITGFSGPLQALFRDLVDSVEDNVVVSQ
ncbi:MAG: type II secretion system protein [Planctomycetota bacterium]|jgi:prepilin-type N-terminal cleavage/methylation domain-containing protein